jgi:hypothetical protein
VWERLVRELRRGRPLCRDDSGREWSTLMQLSEKLPQGAPSPWAEQIREALKGRVRRLQEAEVA